MAKEFKKGCLFYVEPNDEVWQEIVESKSWRNQENLMEGCLVYVDEDEGDEIEEQTIDDMVTELIEELFEENEGVELDVQRSTEHERTWFIGYRVVTYNHFNLGLWQ